MRFEWAFSLLREGRAVRLSHWPEDSFLMLSPPSRKARDIFYYSQSETRLWNPQSSLLLLDNYEEVDLFKALVRQKLGEQQGPSVIVDDVEIPIKKFTEWFKDGSFDDKHN